jgi:hypothetical protein
MAFTGTAVFEEVTDGLVRVTGLSLVAAGVAGVFGLDGDAGAEVELPAQFQPRDYGDVDLAESVQIDVQRTSAEVDALVIQIVKTLAPFRITITNNDAANASGALEFYIRFH